MELDNPGKQGRLCGDHSFVVYYKTVTIMTYKLVQTYVAVTLFTRLIQYVEDVAGACVVTGWLVSYFGGKRRNSFLCRFRCRHYSFFVSKKLQSFLGISP